MKSHNDWIVDLYYKEMVAQKNMEKNHDQHSQPTEQTPKSTERDRRISKKLQTQESTYKV